MHSLLQFVEVLPKNGNTQAVNKLKKIFNIFRKGHHSIGIDAFNVWGERLCLSREPGLANS